MAIKRPYEENIDGQDSNVPPPVTGTTSAAGATSNGSRRVVAVLQDHATGRHMPVHAGDSLDAVVAAAATAGLAPNSSLWAVPAAATPASNMVAAVGQHQLEFIERRAIARGPEDARGAKYSYKQRTCVVCKSPNAAHYCTAPSCGLAVVLCGAHPKRCRDTHVNAVISDLSSHPAPNSADGAPAMHGVSGGSPFGPASGSSSSTAKRQRRTFLAPRPARSVPVLDPSLAAQHRLDYIERRTLPPQPVPSGSSYCGPRYSYKQRTCVVCKSPNAAHYCTGCGPRVVVCGNSAKGCYATHVLSGVEGRTVQAAAEPVSDVTVTPAPMPAPMPAPTPAPPMEASAEISITPAPMPLESLDINDQNSAGALSAECLTV